jgi:hypothetical protein
MIFRDYCTQAQFEGLHNAVDGVRSTSATVRVDKQALINLLMDHAELHRLLSETADLPMKGDLP